MSDPEQTETPTPAQPAEVAPSVAALAAENAALRQQMAAGAVAFEDAKSKAAEFEGLYTGLQTKAKRDRIVGQIVGDFQSPTAVRALAGEAWADIDTVARPDGSTDDEYEALQAKALHERLASLDGGMLLKPQGGTLGGGRMTGPTDRTPRRHNPYDVKPKNSQ